MKNLEEIKDKIFEINEDTLDKVKALKKESRSTNITKFMECHNCKSKINVLFVFGEQCPACKELIYFGEDWKLIKELEKELIK